jgi:hypothetical protein
MNGLDWRTLEGFQCWALLILVSNNGDPSGDYILMLLEKQHFSRFKAIIVGMQAKQEHKSVNLEVALEEFDEIFHGAEVKKSTTNMAKWLKQETGYIAKKKQRGWKKVEQTA